MAATAQIIRVKAMIGKKWLQNVVADVLDPVEQLIVRVFDQLGGRRLVHLAVTGKHTTA